MAREGEDGRELSGGGEREVVSWFVPDLPLLEKSAANLGAKVGVEPGEIEAIGRVVFGSKFRGGSRARGVVEVTTDFSLFTTTTRNNLSPPCPPQRTKPPKAQELDWGISPSNLLGMHLNLWQHCPALLVLVLF